MCVYRDLLEVEDRPIFDIYQLLLEKSEVEMSEFQKRYGLYDKNVKTAIQEWKMAGNHLAFGLDFLIQQNTVTMFMTDQFSERDLFAYYLKKSSLFEILYILLDDPIITMKELENRTYLGRKTIRRRFSTLSDLLKTYGITITKNNPQLIAGSELQQRFLKFHLEMLARPELVKAGPEQKFRVIKDMAYNRERLGCVVLHEEIAPAKLGVIESYFDYMLDEQGYLFLWQQLLGLEPLWLGQVYQGFAEKALGKERHLAYFGQASFQQLYQIHAYGMIFDGDLLLQLTPHKVLSEDARRIHQVAKRYLPDYGKLIQKHPEIPCAYQKLLDNRLYIDRFRETLMEDPYLVRVRQTG